AGGEVSEASRRGECAKYTRGSACCGAAPDPAGWLCRLCRLGQGPAARRGLSVDPGGGLEGTTLPADTLLLLIDAVGTFAFALSGGALAVQKRFDIFGVLFLAFVTAVTGGVARDLLIGSVPPEAIANWRPFAIALAGGLVTIIGHPLVSALQRPVLLLDAIGLGLFAVT